MNGNWNKKNHNFIKREDMKTRLLTIFICALSWGTSAQTFGKGQQYKTAFSFYSASHFSKGFEIRGEFENWYVAMQAEQFIRNQQNFLNWGFSVGLQKRFNYFDSNAGIRLGFMTIDGRKKPAHGLEAELDYNITESVFVGVRGSYDVYMDSPDIKTPVSKTLTRAFLKIGYKF